jgi:hypothetical protein
MKIIYRFDTLKDKEVDYDYGTRLYHGYLS